MSDDIFKKDFNEFKLTLSAFGVEIKDKFLNTLKTEIDKELSLSESVIDDDATKSLNATINNYLNNVINNDDELFNKAFNEFQLSLNKSLDTLEAAVTNDYNEVVGKQLELKKAAKSTSADDRVAEIFAKAIGEHL